MTTWVQILSVATNVSILIVGIKLVRHLTRIEFKVDMMWAEFMRKIDIKIVGDKE